MAQSIRWLEKDSIFRMVNYKKRTIVGDQEYFEQDNVATPSLILPFKIWLH